MARLKVYQGNFDGRKGRMVAASSQAEAARRMGVTMYHFRQFFSETGNAQQITVAMSKPGVAFEFRLSSPNPEYVAL